MKEQFLMSWSDRGKRSILSALIFLFVLQIADLVTTFIALSSGHIEANPIADWLIDTNLIIPIKLGIVALLILNFFRKDHDTNPMAIAAPWFVAGIYTMVVVFNLLTIFLG